ncbi:ankyrin repeat domain-containing protein [Verrucomicrobia bacterium]|nr:ankyrin repeat domain-containing protein [Verrucomicrobiota bacterium]
MADGADVNAKGGMTGGAPLHYAAMFGRKEIAELLIAKGADVNAKDEAGRTPLYEAAWQGRGEIAELLIAKGADVNAKNEDGKTPLDSAIPRKRPGIAGLLRKHGGKTAKELEAAGN